MNILCVFAGQGYKNSTLFNFFQGNEQALSMLHELSSAMHLDFFNTPKALGDPYHAQRFIGAYQLSLFNSLKPLLNAHKINFAGYSLGEVTAFLASVQASAQEINSLLSFRTQLMTSILQQDKSEYDLLYINGQFIPEDIKLLCTKYHCYIAIINSEQGLTLGGNVSDLNDLLAQLPHHHLTRAQFLDIHLPSHTPLYANKKGLFHQYLDSQFTRPLQHPILSAIQRCKIYDVEEEKRLLDEQLYTTLQWYSLCTLIPEYQYDLILDLGPGEAMTKQLQTIRGDLPIITLSNYNNISGALSVILARIRSAA
jgi:[acyl-carrier-protein] S-malonyltransferase